jgi:hypothetical protein
MEKIGISVYYFYFKSAESKRLMSACESLKVEEEELIERLNELTRLARDRDEANYDDLLKELNDISAIEKELKSKLDSANVMTTSDAQALQDRINQLEKGSNRWVISS